MLGDPRIERVGQEFRIEGQTMTYGIVRPFIYFPIFPTIQIPREYLEAEINAFFYRMGNTGIYYICFSYQCAQQYAELMKRIITFNLDQFQMKTPNETHHILQSLVFDETLFGNPDNHKEFRHYSHNFGNKVKSLLEIYTHPLSLATSFINAPAQLLVRPLVEDAETLGTLNKMYDFVYRGTLAHKQHVYKSFLRESIIEYIKVQQIVNQGRGLLFKLNPDRDSFGIDDLRAI